MLIPKIMYKYRNIFDKDKENALPQLVTASNMKIKMIVALTNLLTCAICSLPILYV